MTEGYRSKEYGVPTKRFVQTMDLKDDSELIRKYREAHDQEHFWDEIKEGIKAVGIRQEEWEKHVAEFQNCSAEATSDEKWQMMERMFYLYE